MSNYVPRLQGGGGCRLQGGGGFRLQGGVQLVFGSASHMMAQVYTCYTTVKWTNKDTFTPLKTI